MKSFAQYLSVPTWIKWITISIALVIALSLALWILWCIVYLPHKFNLASPQSLAQYGDFIGGVLGTFISMLSLVVTIYLAFLLKRFEKENSNSAIAAQRQLAIMQMKHYEVNLYKSNGDECMSIWINNLISIEKVTLVYDRICAANDRIKTMFPTLLDDKTFAGNKLFHELVVTSMNAIIMVTDYDKMPGISQEGRQAKTDLLEKMFENYEIGRGHYLSLAELLGAWVIE